MVIAITFRRGSIKRTLCVYCVQFVSAYVVFRHVVNAPHRNVLLC